jgi:hypothetical protein
MGIMGRWDDIFVFLSGENINGSEVTLGVTVFASLGGGDSSDFARMVLNANVSI